MNWLRLVDETEYLHRKTLTRFPISVGKFVMSIQASKFHQSTKKAGVPKTRTESLIYYTHLEVHIRGVEKDTFNNFKYLIELLKYNGNTDRENVFYNIPVELVDKLVQYLETK